MLQEQRPTSIVGQEEPFCAATHKAYELLLLGQQAIAQTHLEDGLDYFRRASALKPGDPKLHFEQGLSLFDLGSHEGNEQSALLANKKFKMATSLLPEYFEAWHAWGTCLVHLGHTMGSFHFFQEALVKLQKAKDCSGNKESQTLSDLHAEYALVQSILAEKSQEACDWQQAVESFETASHFLAPKNPDFWIHFGKACLELAHLVGETKLHVKAIHCFKHALTQDPSAHASWIHLAHTICFLYTHTQDEDHFAQANECFTTATQLHPLDASLWLDWAEFLQKCGKASQDLKRLRLAAEKAQQALDLYPEEPRALACLGETLAWIGEKEENIELIHEGQNRAIEAVEKQADNPWLWLSLGETYRALGKYFTDVDSYYQAIEKFQEGLSLDRSAHPLWFAMASAYHTLGESLEDIDPLEKALRFYQKAIDLAPKSALYHFAYASALSLMGELTQEKEELESAILEFERAIQLQKNAMYLHPSWLFAYAKTLDAYAEYFEEEKHYHRAIEIFSHVLMIDPDFPKIHYHLALVYSHLGELSEDITYFYKALHFFKIALKQEEDNDQIPVDLGVTFINIAEHTIDATEKLMCYEQGEARLIQAAKAGNLQAYYQLACLFSLQKDLTKSLFFLHKAEELHALPFLEELIEDEWLENTRNSSAFHELLELLEKKESYQEDL